MQPFYHQVKLAEYDKIIEGVFHCVGIRNQYAHCNWNGRGRGLVFTNFEWMVKEKKPPQKIIKRKVNLALLKQQEAYFSYVQRGLMYLQCEYQKRTGKEPTHVVPAPLEVPKPPKYIGEGKQVNPNRRKSRKRVATGKRRAASKSARSR